MKVKHYSPNLNGNQTERQDEVICDDANIYVNGSSTLIIANLISTGAVSIHCNSSSTIIIDRITCDSLDLNNSYSSTIRLSGMDCQTMSISVSYSSTLNIPSGTIGNLTGSVQWTSTVKNLAQVKNLDVWVDNPKDKAPISHFFASSYYNQ
ncbi:GIN domain-containing protein [Egbenema bharatensis]|uniref:GIN domain-containing protein n=1 Tax=Egbenema bharatensis TaxID=3463334 RepID=UPI003A85B6C8